MAPGGGPPMTTITVRRTLLMRERFDVLSRANTRFVLTAVVLDNGLPTFYGLRYLSMFSTATSEERVFLAPAVEEDPRVKALVTETVTAALKSLAEML